MAMSKVKERNRINDDESNITFLCLPNEAYGYIFHFYITRSLLKCYHKIYIAAR